MMKLRQDWNAAFIPHPNIRNFDYLSFSMIGDFCRWGDRLVYGCDDSAHREFLNKRNAKGGIEGPGQANSNLWFTDPYLPGELGPSTANGALWLEEQVQAGQPSEPMLFQGWDYISIWIHHTGNQSLKFTLETGDGNAWEVLNTFEVAPSRSQMEVLVGNAGKEWVRVKTDKNTLATVHLAFTDKEKRTNEEQDIFIGLKPIHDKEYHAGLLYGLGDNRRKLGRAGQVFGGNQEDDLGYYELDEKLNLNKTEDRKQFSYIKENFAIPDSSHEVQFIIEIEPIGNGPWMDYQSVTVKPGVTFTHEFPEGIQGRWIRFTSDRACRASAWLTYE